MAASIVGNSLRLDRGEIIDLGIASVVKPHQTDANQCYIDDYQVDLGTPYLALKGSISAVLGE